MTKATFDKIADGLKEARDTVANGWPDDPIKAALDVAGQAMARVQGYADENTTDAAAAAIAAFLWRAADVHAGCYGHMEPRELLRQLAAAIERAAGGGA